MSSRMKKRVASHICPTGLFKIKLKPLGKKIKAENPKNKSKIYRGKVLEKLTKLIQLSLVDKSQDT